MTSFNDEENDAGASGGRKSRCRAYEHRRRHQTMRERTIRNNILFTFPFALAQFFSFSANIEQVKIPMCRLDDVSTSGFVTRTATTRERGKNPLFPIQTDAILMAKYFRLAPADY